MTVIDTSSDEIEVVGTLEYIVAKDLEIAVDGRVYAIDEDYYYADVNVYDKDMQPLDPLSLVYRLVLVRADDVCNEF